MSPWPDPQEILPHDAPARFVHAILSVDGATIVCEAGVPHDSPWVEDGRCPSFVGLEIAAQAAAALEALRVSGADGSPRKRLGYLVRVRHLRAAVSWLPAGERLVARVCRQGLAGPLHVYSATLSLRDQEILRGGFSTFGLTT